MKQSKALKDFVAYFVRNDWEKTDKILSLSVMHLKKDYADYQMHIEILANGNIVLSCNDVAEAYASFYRFEMNADICSDHCGWSLVGLKDLIYDQFQIQFGKYCRRKKPARKQDLKNRRYSLY